MNSTLIKNFLKKAAEIMCAQRDNLIQEDSIVGDGDLGLTMSDGFSAAYNAVKDNGEEDCGKVLYIAGKAMSTAVPSTMGTLMASGLMQAGKTLKGKTELDRDDINEIFKSFLDGVIHRGKANIGEKTFVDGLNPAIETLIETKELPLEESAQKAYMASVKGYNNTKGMIAVHGRAATRGEASRELLDPGALVATFIMEAFYRS
ncbi:dihydroxyacetone kinase subunit L, partial [Clostridium sp.]|uniref:dihydroxyacetone kinase subunit L n=1 Tax=Clostridium sp. TaxID=1506 RepID=UPI001A60DA66